MPPFDQSRQYLYDLPGEKRSSIYERWLNLRGGNDGDGNEGNGPDVEERDGNDDDDDRDDEPNAKSKPGNDGNDKDGNDGGNKKGNNDNGNGKGKNNGNNNQSDSSAAASIIPVAMTTPPLEPTTTLESTTLEPTTTAVAELQPQAQGAFQPAIQPAIAADPTPVVTLNPETTPTAEPLTLPTATMPVSIPATTEVPPEPTTTAPPQEPTTSSTMQPLPETTTSTTPIFAPMASITSTTAVSTSTELTSVYTSSPAVTTSVVTMTMSASAVVTSITATTTEILVLTTSGSQRKGEKDHNHDHGNSTTSSTPALADTNGLPPGMAVSKDPPLSPTAEHVLLAAGIIGAFILSGFLLYLFVRLRKIPVGGKFGDFLDRHPRLDRIFSVIPAIRNRGQWTRRSSSPGWDKGIDSFQENVPAQKSMDAFYAPGVGYDEKSKQVSRDSELMDEKASIKYGMSSNPNAPLHVTNPSATMSFYNVQQPNNAYIPNAARMSELSSLSSGFGDAQIDVPESGPTNNGTLNSNMNGYGSTMNTMNSSNAATVNTLQPYRQSFMQRASRAFAEPLTSRFSWTTANQSDVPGNGQRDTVYTTTSEDSAPRFRTIHSWVNQQTHRVERGRTEPVPSMPPLPPSQRLLNRGSEAPASPALNRSSEAPAFRQHPGEEVNIPEATRIESAILDRKLGNDGL